MFTQDSLFDSNELLSMRVLPSLLIYECLPRIASSILLKLLSIRVLSSLLIYECLPKIASSKEPMELEVINNFHHLRSHKGSNSGPFDPKLNVLNHLTTDP